MSEQFSISWEWEPADGVSTPELSATFARLRVEVGENNLTLVEDKSSRSSRRSIYVALYPLAEWIAYNWWSLNYDSRPSRGYTRTADNRHSVGASGDGFKWPNLTMIPGGGRIRLVWRGESGFSAHSPIRFLSSGDTFVDREVVARELAGLVQATIGRLREMAVAGTALEEEWTHLQSMDPEEREFCIAAARLGLDPLSEGLDFEGEILRADSCIESPSAFLDFLEGARPGLIDESISWVHGGIDVLKEGGGPADEQPFSLIRQGIYSASMARYSHPWRTGWLQAQIARRVTGVADDARFDLAPYLSEVVNTSEDRGLLALGRAGAEPSSNLVISQKAPNFARRFTVARALWRQVATNDDLFIITNAYTDKQQIERAFAAELLAPAAGIAHVLDVEPGEAEQGDVDALAEYFDVSSILIEHQLENQLIGRSYAQWPSV